MKYYRAIGINYLFIVLSFAIISCDEIGDDSAEKKKFAESLEGDTTSTTHGEATWYDANTLGNCGIEYPADKMYAAMNRVQYNNSNTCGTCVEITRLNSNKKVVVKILDQCPECPFGDIDLSPEVFSKLGTLKEGRIPISWRYVPCPSTPKISIRYKSGSSRYWTAIQVINHRNQVKKVEARDQNGNFQNLSRTDYNYFLDDNGFYNGDGPDGPYTLRITDIYGNQLSGTWPFEVNRYIYIDQQFP